MTKKDSLFCTEDNILNELPPQLVTDYIKNGLFTHQCYHKDEIIHLEGDSCNQIELIINGEIAIERIGEGGDLMTVNRFCDGCIIGANLIFSSSEYYPMTVTSKMESNVIIIPKDILFELCNQYPAFLIQFIRIISDLSVLIGNKMKNRISRTIKDSIITYLNKQYNLQHTYQIQLTMSKKALSEMFGISRTSLSRELQKMQTAKLIEYDSKTITIIDKSLIR